MTLFYAENRLVKAESMSSAPVGSKRRVEFAYDFASRMIRRTEYDGSSGSYSLTNDMKFFYDGLRCMQEHNITSGLIHRSYVWGVDLSGSMGGAGGVGGLLSVVLHNQGSVNGAYYPWYDANGNILGYVTSTNGTTRATYEYSPFGEMIRAEGDLAKLFPYRFSTKRYDDTLDLVQYEYRFYKPATGTWLSKDPISELGGLNLYGFVGNDSINYFDRDGRDKYRPHSFRNQPDAFVPPPSSSGSALLDGEFYALGEIIHEVADSDADADQQLPISRSIANSLTINHYDVFYGAIKVYNGHGGPIPPHIQSQDPKAHSYSRYLLTRVTSKDKKIRWGKFAELSCNCADDEARLDSLRHAPVPRKKYHWFWNNSQQDTEHAIEGSCLTGFDSLPPFVGPSESNYRSEEEQRGIDNAFWGSYFSTPFIPK